LRSDHVAGGAIVLGAVVILALSGDLPTGRLSMPGAGMLPKLLCGFAIVFGLVLLLRGRGSVPLSQIDWGDLRHAVPVIVITVLAVSLYTTLGFLVTMTGLLFSLLQFERCRLFPSAAYSIGVAVATYALFVHVLKSPLERGLIAF
jgi:hypothetical protein